MITLMRMLILMGGTVLALDTCRAHSTFSATEGPVAEVAQAADVSAGGGAGSRRE